MDPVSAAGFASSIITFIDFSFKLVQGSAALYQSATGTSAENAAIGTIVDDLRNVTDAIAQPPTPETDSQHWRDLRKLAADCNGVSKELADILETLKRKEGNKAWRSLEAAWKSMRKSKEIAAIEERLKTYRVQLLLRTNLILSDNQTSIQKQLDELAKGDAAHFDKTIRELTDVRHEIRNLEAKLLAEAGQSMQVSCGADHDTSVLASLRGELEVVIRSLEAVPQRTPADLLVLNRLHFGTLYSRFDSIHDAEFGTFRWFLKDEPSDIESVDQDHDNAGSSPDVTNNIDNEDIDKGKISDENNNEDGEGDGDAKEDKDKVPDHDASIRAEARRSFQEWLASGSGAFHICGKPGSGKSTLMKLFAQDPGLKIKLHRWAGDKKLVFASFFFWISGDDQQCSLEGLYRSLLFEALKMCPDLAKAAFPDFWRAVQVSYAERAAWNQAPFRLPELRQAMKNLVQTPGHQRHRFCFFIDGLDEFEGDSNDHWELAQLLRQWTESQDVKLCVSSRPHHEFLHVFEAKQRLHLHELTKDDIRCFVSGKLSKEHTDHVDPAFLGETIARIIYNATGVFLWVRLVVRSLVEGIRRHDSRRTLEQRINHMPGDLQALFRELFDGITPEDRQISDQMLLLAAKCSYLAVDRLSWLEDLADPIFPFEPEFPRLSEEQRSQRRKVMKSRIKNLSGGLLETHEEIVQGYIRGPSANFFHRTARDFVLQPDMTATMMHRLGDHFDIESAHERLCLADFRSTEHAFRRSVQLVDIFEGRMASPHVLTTLAKELDEESTEQQGISQCRGASYDNRFGSMMFRGSPSSVSTFSFLHMLAFYQQRDYVLDALRKTTCVNPQQNGFCLLLSAYLGPRRQNRTSDPSLLVGDLIAVGETLDHPVYGSFHDSDVQLPAWIAYLHSLGSSWLRDSSCVPWTDFEIMLGILPTLDIFWEVSLRPPENLRATFPLDQPTTSITLEEMIVWSKPPNMDVLLRELVRRRSGNERSLYHMVASWLSPARTVDSEPANYRAEMPSKSDSYIVGIRVGDQSWHFSRPSIHFSVF
ncbi:hypothetical protein B0T11DRAFT_50133 [Plectosphaerella cucumerina]|uniref:NACHT domain-containing protein n=1 Tax=Plectosphaerella cucumerina TaxID=40658 RepID=A0A8K0TK65_9PEZI|nr:hypothetical protein B0T11DRAFT_50133 [Plectosphaerella cucumerina]